jgi:aliphatic sulfonates family ABC transporter substrate-binding protein
MPEPKQVAAALHATSKSFLVLFFKKERSFSFLAFLFCFTAHAETVRIGYQKSAAALVVLKQHHDLETALAPTGVQWVQFQAGPPIMEAMNAGAIDLGYAGESPPVFAQAAGVDIVYVAAVPTSGANHGVLVRRDSALKNFADLRGKRIAFTKATSAHYVLLRLLAAAGLASTDIQPVYLPPAEGRAAIDTASVDAWVIWDPFYAEAQRDPALRLLTDGSVAPSANFILARRAYAASHPDVIVKTRQAVLAAGLWSDQHRAALAHLMSGVTGVDEAAERTAADRTNFRYNVMDAASIRRQQGVADLYEAQHIIPAHVDIGAAAWAAPGP